MKTEDVKVGQVWARDDGRLVTLTEERQHRGARELLCVPEAGQGRKSWKWDGGITNDFTLVHDI